MLIHTVSNPGSPVPSRSLPVGVTATASAPTGKVAAANTQDTAPQTKVSGEPTPAQLKSAVDKINKSMQEINSNLQFSVDEDTKRVVVKVIESQTGKVIKQFPSEEALAIAKAIDRFQQGFLVKQSA